ncbi:type I inositol-1,4,5-trisphosphate 5-phosphatase [Culex quinquefasciatus]|uniref:Type I inositol-1,4,5-trisphosphate 5-phosphatase n=1 Tax=Culex quinquefasciatus TaxID=7176 RepID=B0WHS1_CULQU|nr:type I inositol-1,4,5-trisphosphate 5-phosphatase [Culex quinquefasciatus]|eukprot:XP_001848255.1 type I inositol-1,4,5-trisphosphate 5-phosphatase [Culex quinquefasciatus]
MVMVALGNLYFAIRTIDHLQIWNFLTHEWDTVAGKNIHTGNIESVASKEKAKFPQQFFPEVFFQFFSNLII